MRKLVLGFRTILRAGKPATLHRWMEQARKTGIPSLVRFVRILKQDRISAVNCHSLAATHGEFHQTGGRAQDYWQAVGSNLQAGEIAISLDFAPSTKGN
jgi:hypothetical protein